MSMIDKDPHNEVRMSRRGEMRKDSSVRSNIGQRLGRDALGATSPKLRINMGRGSAEADKSPEDNTVIFNPADAIHEGAVNNEWVEDLVTHIEAAGYVGVTWHEGEETREITEVLELPKRTDLVILKGDGKVGRISTARLPGYFTRKIEDNRLLQPIQVNLLDD